MVTISLCLIVKNEAAVLARCLNSVKSAVDEIIIVDTGSTDDTKAIAAKFTDQVYDFKWIDDFAAARNEAFSKATMDYQMWLDADDVLPAAELAKLLALKEKLDPAVEIVTMKYYTHFDAQGNLLNSSTRGRLFKRTKRYRWEDPIHEYITLDGIIHFSDIIVHHRQNPKEGHHKRNLSIYEKMESSGAALTPRQIYYFARELKDHAQWAKAVYYFEKFLQTGQGWSEDNIATCYNLSILYNALGDQDKILPILTKSFLYGEPRAEICSEIAYYYKRAKNTKLAYAWFKIAAALGEPESIGFILRDYWGYIPNIECSVCASELGDLENAKMYNELAGTYKQNDPAVEYNRKYFASL
ncbi:MAG: glycosyltransferase [Sporomusaceae bacterium]|jgi:glycosyltransferase involved in cell wall biosynthesis|nr:glycosyltransferase [Sporomusaceae bacterium]